MLIPILIGIGLTIATVAIHAAGTTWWIDRLLRHDRRLDGRPVGRLFGFRLLCTTTTLLLLLNVAEIVVWAIAYRILPHITNVATFEETVYFSAVTFTALGYGDVVLDPPWRILSTIEAIIGLLIFGWSTALLLSVVQRVWASRSQRI